MQIASGKVVQGRVELDAELPEGASVTVIASDGDETFEVDAETEKKAARRDCGMRARRDDSVGTSPVGDAQPRVSFVIRRMT